MRCTTRAGTSQAPVNWHDLATASHYQTAVAVKHALQDGDTDAAMKGLEELIDALSRSDRRALESHLVRLMQHIIKWRLQPERRSWSWVATIRNARFAMARIQQDTPSLTRQVIESLWDDMVLAARYEAEGEMNRRISPVTLTWEEVFETEYTLEEDDAPHQGTAAPARARRPRRRPPEH